MISLMIADDEAIVRNGLRDAIDWDALGVTVTDCVGDGLALVERAIASHADILLVDIRMSGCHRGDPEKASGLRMHYFHSP